MGFQYILNSIQFQQIHIDTSHFFWLVTYFLKFAAQLELDLEHIKCVLSYKIVSYLTYEAVILYEQLELTSRHYEIDLEPSLRRMHLVSDRTQTILYFETHNNLILLIQFMLFRSVFAGCNCN